MTVPAFGSNGATSTTSSSNGAAANAGAAQGAGASSAAASLSAQLAAQQQAAAFAANQAAIQQQQQGGQSPWQYQGYFSSRSSLPADIHRNRVTAGRSVCYVYPGQAQFRLTPNLSLDVAHVRGKLAYAVLRFSDGEPTISSRITGRWQSTTARSTRHILDIRLPWRVSAPS